MTDDADPKPEAPATLHGPLRERPWFAPPYELAEADLEHMLGFEAIARKDADTPKDEEDGELILYAMWACPLTRSAVDDEHEAVLFMQSRGPVTVEVAHAFVALHSGCGDSAMKDGVLAVKNARMHRMLSRAGFKVRYELGVN